MSFRKKIISTYSKSLFQNGLQEQNQALKEFGPSNGEKLEGYEIVKFFELVSQPNERFTTVYSIGEELALLRSVLISSELSKGFFQNPTIEEAKKYALLVSLFSGMSRLMKSFLQLLTEKGQLSLLPEIADDYDDILLKVTQTTKVQLITASALKENYGLLLLETLRKLTNSKEIILNVAYSPQLLGGFILEYNSTATDLSLLKEFSLFFSEN